MASLSFQVEKTLKLQSLSSPEFLSALNAIHDVIADLDAPIDPRKNLFAVIESVNVEKRVAFLNAYEALAKSIDPIEQDAFLLEQCAEEIKTTLDAAERETATLVDEAHRLQEEIRQAHDQKHEIEEFLAQMRLTADEQETLKNGPIGPDFFGVMQRVEAIHAECKQRLRKGHHQACLEVLGTMAVIQEASFERLFRWVQDQCAALGNYVGDMLAWVHQALAHEKEALDGLLAPKKAALPDEIRPREVLAHIFEEVAAPLKARVDQAIPTCDGPVAAFRLAGLLQFYAHTAARLLAPTYAPNPAGGGVEVAREGTGLYKALTGCCEGAIKSFTGLLQAQGANVLLEPMVGQDPRCPGGLDIGAACTLLLLDCGAPLSWDGTCDGVPPLSWLLGARRVFVFVCVKSFHHPVAYSHRLPSVLLVWGAQEVSPECTVPPKLRELMSQLTTILEAYATSILQTSATTSAPSASSSTAGAGMVPAAPDAGFIHVSNAIRQAFEIQIQKTLSRCRIHLTPHTIPSTPDAALHRDSSQPAPPPVGSTPRAPSPQPPASPAPSASPSPSASGEQPAMPTPFELIKLDAVLTSLLQPAYRLCVLSASSLPASSMAVFLINCLSFIMPGRLGTTHHASLCPRSGLAVCRRAFYHFFSSTSLATALLAPFGAAAGFASRA
ncbi:putative Conserved oligomeric Golgi complex subunit 6 [Paratrimastix pyriformis]|uniref:Conserved oligomeric Golgi complex subunit 6 n=1 Tax=Paratrimastix pyriformis TaxID=342808 RepID=A0ABQ8UGU9_9EUKA|nr:putative Conserved oligomeric Golgi complex subunit 6 [Paratrimastix pyriformis]